MRYFNPTPNPNPNHFPCKEADCKITFKRIWPNEADDIMLGLKKFKRSRGVLEDKQWEKAQVMHAHEFMELHNVSFV